MKLPAWLQPRLRLWAIYNELGYIPWKKPAKPRKRQKQKDEGVYMGTREAIIPFLNDDSKRTFAHLLLRPGYMMRDYILRGDHDRYLAPFTALLVFYSVFTLLLAIVKPDADNESMGQALLRGIREATVQTDTTRTSSEHDMKVVNVTQDLLHIVGDAVIMTRLDKYPEEADTPWKKSLAAFEGELRSKGIHMFLGNFLFLWLAMTVLFRKRGIRASGAAAASAYVQCQYCVFMFLLLIASWGKAADLGIAAMGVLLLIDYRQLFGISWKKSFWLTAKTGLLYLLMELVLWLLIASVLVGIAFYKLP